MSPIFDAKRSGATVAGRSNSLAGISLSAAALINSSKSTIKKSLAHFETRQKIEIFVCKFCKYISHIKFRRVKIILFYVKKYTTIKETKTLEGVSENAPTTPRYPYLLC